jgi:hypothetical protein
LSKTWFSKLRMGVLAEDSPGHARLGEDAKAAVSLWMEMPGDNEPSEPYAPSRLSDVIVCHPSDDGIAGVPVEEEPAGMV